MPTPRDRRRMADRRAGAFRLVEHAAAASLPRAFACAEDVAVGAPVLVVNAGVTAECCVHAFGLTQQLGAITEDSQLPAAYHAAAWLVYVTTGPNGSLRFHLYRGEQTMLTGRALRLRQGP
jgi:hypothetical protein